MSSQQERCLVLMSLTLLIQCQGYATTDTNPVTDDVTTLIRIVSELTDRVKDLETTQKNMKLEIDRLNDVTADLQKQVDRCTKEQHPLDEVISPVLTSRSIKGNVANGIKNNTDVMPDALTHVQEAQEITRRQIVNGEKADRVGNLEGMVAFYAQLTSTVNLIVDYTIKYGSVVTNRGGGYNPTTGVFTCPKSGLYVFSWTTTLDTVGYVQTAITRNGINRGYGIIQSTQDRHGKDTNIAVLELSPGDVVLVRVLYVGSTPVTLLHHRTYFSGFLLR